MIAKRVAATAGAAVAWLAIAATVLAATALAASPSPDAAGGDPRSSGQGPGLVGDPLFALLVVVGIGILSVVATLVYVRLTGERGS